MKSFAISYLSAQIYAKTNLIIDTDMGLDVDDVGALSVAHNLANKGQTNILATIHNSGFDLGIAAVKVINNYYGRDKVPIGAYKGPFGAKYGHFPDSQNKYAEDLISNYPNSGITSSK